MRSFRTYGFSSSPKRLPPKTHGNAATKIDPLEWLQNIYKWAAKVGVPIVAICVGLLFLSRSSAVTGILIDPISLPKSLVDAGYTPEGTADEFAEQLRLSSTDSELAQFVSTPIFRPTELPEVIGVQTKTNTRAVALFVRSLVGKEKSIHAEIREDAPQFDMVLRITDNERHRLIRCPIKREAFQDGLRECAEQSIRDINPALFLLSLYVKESQFCGLKDNCHLEETKSFAKEMILSRDAAQTKWAKTLLAFAYIEEGNKFLAEQQLGSIPDISTFAPAQLANALTKDSDNEAIPILRSVTFQAPDLIGPDVVLFQRLLFRGTAPGFPPTQFLKAGSPEVQELEVIISRVEGMSGITADYYAKMMRASLLMRTGYTWGAMTIMKELTISNPRDATALIEAGDIQWTQSYIETTLTGKAPFLSRAAAYYWAATKISPEWRVPRERLSFALSLQEDGDVEAPRRLASTEPELDYLPVIVAMTANECDIRSFLKASNGIAAEGDGLLSQLWNIGGPARASFWRREYVMANHTPASVASATCKKDSVLTKVIEKSL